MSAARPSSNSQDMSQLTPLCPTKDTGKSFGLSSHLAIFRSVAASRKDFSAALASEVFLVSIALKVVSTRGLSKAPVPA